MNVIQIVQTHLRANGYDGIFNVDGDCACDRTHLAPADCLAEKCQPGAWRVCTRCREKYMSPTRAGLSLCRDCAEPKRGRK